jgi:hypothetical protein
MNFLLAARSHSLQLEDPTAKYSALGEIEFASMEWHIL